VRIYKYIQRWHYCLRHRSAVARLLGLWVQISLTVLMFDFVFVACCASSVISDPLISFQRNPTGCLYLTVFDLGTYKMKRPRSDLSCSDKKERYFSCSY